MIEILGAKYDTSTRFYGWRSTPSFVISQVSVTLVVVLLKQHAIQNNSALECVQNDAAFRKNRSPQGFQVLHALTMHNSKLVQ